MAGKVVPSQEALAAMRQLPSGTFLIVDGTIAEATVGYTMSCRGIDPDQMGVYLLGELPEPVGEFSRPIHDLPLFISNDILRDLEEEYKCLHVLALPLN